MLDRKGHGLDLSRVWASKQPVKVDTQGVSGQFGIETRDQSQGSVSMVMFNMELLS